MTPTSDVLDPRRGRHPRPRGVRRRAARPGRAGRRGRLAPARGRRRRRRCARLTAAVGAARRRRSPRPTRAPSRRSRDVRAQARHGRAGRARSCPGWATGCCCTPGRRSTWERVCDPQRRALLAAALFEGWAATREEAAALLERGEIVLASGNEHAPRRADDRRLLAVDAGLGRRGRDVGARAFSTLNEGPGRTLWFGVGDDESIERLRFFRDDLGPRLARMLEHRGPIDVFGLAAQGLNMGDELHMRSQATGQPADPRPRARARRRRRRGRRALPRRQPPLLPEPDDGGGQVRVAGDGGLRRLERRLADLAQRHRRRHPARGHAGPLVRRARPRRSPTRCCARATARTTRRATSATPR